MMRIQCFMVEPVKVIVDGKESNDHWIRKETGETHRWPHEFGAGAMWYADWLTGRKFEDVNGNAVPATYGTGPDGRILVVQTPGGGWIIDSRASNCTMKNDDEHRCWIRHGTPPEITVDKNGLTCGAGAGSIQAGNYHGFLRNGWLED